jgi:F-type H+-transporting ATPase subunit delta
VSDTASTSAGIAQRYAIAAFELAHDAGGLAALDADVEALDAALAASPELRAAITSPVIRREEMGGVVTALAAEMGLTEVMRGTLGVMAQNRRLFALPALLAELRRLSAEARGEVTAEVTSASVLSKSQADRLAAAIQAKVGKTVKLNVSVDEALIGGLIVKVGSKMIDTSIRSRLAALQNSMKEVG